MNWINYSVFSSQIRILNLPKNLSGPCRGPAKTYFMPKTMLNLPYQRPQNRFCLGWLPSHFLLMGADILDLCVCCRTLLQCILLIAVRRFLISQKVTSVDIWTNRASVDRAVYTPWYLTAVTTFLARLTSTFWPYIQLLKIRSLYRYKLDSGSRW